METSPNTPPHSEPLLKLKIVDTFLHSKCAPFHFDNPPVDPIHFSNSMVQTLFDMRGIGLAANQVGYDFRVFAIKGFDSCLFNPKIVHSSETMETAEEGCLSYPGIGLKIKRPDWIRVRFTNCTGQTETKTVGGLTARAIQHEIDHLDGITFFNRAHPFHKDQALRKWKKIRKTLK